MLSRPLGKTELEITPIGYGALKIGRNQKVKYATPYSLPSLAEVERLLNGVLDLGINYLDTAPAYGLSEERVGVALGRRSEELVISTKVGEFFEDGESRYDFSAKAVRESIDQSLQRLKRSRLDIVFVHAYADDVAIQQETEVVPTLQRLKEAGLIRAIGLSGKTVGGAQLALEWADVLMVEYHLNDRSHSEIMAQAAVEGIGVVVKKGLASGTLAPQPAIEFVLANPAVTSLVVGGLNSRHLTSNLASALRVRPGRTS